LLTPKGIKLIWHESVKDIIKRLGNESWDLARVKGFHYQFESLTRPGRGTVPHP